MNKGRDKKQPNIPIAELFEFFKTLNTPSNNEQENNGFDHMIPDVEANNLSENINEVITRDEIRRQHF